MVSPDDKRRDQGQYTLSRNVVFKGQAILNLKWHKSNFMIPFNRTCIYLSSLSLLFVFCSCQPAEKADLILTNGDIYTVNEAQPTAAAIAIKDGRIMAVGTEEEMEAYQSDETEVINLEGQFTMPGFIEGHGHYSGLGQSLIQLNFLRSKSWEEIVAMVEERVSTADEGEWIAGRGWHQEKWTETPGRNIHGYPFHDDLSAVSPDNPVVLRHASGHALFANAKAMEIAGITRETPNPSGGEIVRDASGDAIGVFEERAMGLINRAYNMYLNDLDEAERLANWHRGIELAQKECLTKGITSFQDAGSRFYELDEYRKLAEAGQMDVRLWAMVRHAASEMEGKLQDYRWIGLGDDFLTVRAVKTEVDGALGAFGAWLLEPYNDKADFVGQNTTEIDTVKRIAQLAMQNDMQLCVHAIGDKANQEVLDLMEEQFQANPDKRDLRWRIEHAQHLAVEDIPRFGELGVIPSMQGIHCTSDAPFVVKRLGEKRAREGAYPWRSLLDAGAVVTNGTDAPVEDVDPIESFYATVTRKRADTGLEFFSEQAMTREEGIRSYTLSNAYAAFEETEKGTLEVGKLADIVVLSNNLVTCAEEDIMDTEVLMTLVGGEIKYQKGE